MSNATTEQTLTAEVNGILVRLEDDGYPVTTISCRCPNTHVTEDFSYPSDFFDIYRYEDSDREIQPNMFAEIAEAVAGEFLSNMEAK